MTLIQSARILKRNDMRKLSDFLEKAINRAGVAKTVKAAVVVEQAGFILLQLIPELRHGDCRVLSLRAGTLTIATTSPTIAHDIRLRREPFIEVLQDTFPDIEIKRLRFVPMPYDGSDNF